jgi:hypothetical protein
MPKRGSEWGAFLRTLAILKRLLQSPASADELVAYVQATLGEVYPGETNARKYAFKHDRENLRERLQVKFRFDSFTREYHIVDPGPFGSLELKDESLRGLGILSRDFGNGLGERVYIRALMDDLRGRLPSETQRLLEHQPETLIMGLRQFVDHGHLPPKVWETVKKAVEKRRKLSFDYLSPRYADGKPVYFEIVPAQLKYQDGHWYLRGWVLERRPQEFTALEPEYIRFRVLYIQDSAALKLWPTVYPERFRTPPRYEVHYELSPEIGRGEISHHFSETQITHHENGSAEVRGFTDDLWEAGRLLLGYGEGCIVLGGDELRREMLRRVEKMAKNYGFFSD